MKSDLKIRSECLCEGASDCPLNEVLNPGVKLNDGNLPLKN